jgi:hypothetical protein
LVSRVEINADGRQVIVDHVGDLPYLIEKAMEAWRATEAAPKPPRGFVAPTNAELAAQVVVPRDMLR